MDQRLVLVVIQQEEELVGTDIVEVPLILRAKNKGLKVILQ